MLRRLVMIPTLGRIRERTTEGTVFDALIDRQLKRTISWLSDRDLDRLLEVRRPPTPPFAIRPVGGLLSRRRADTNERLDREGGGPTDPHQLAISTPVSWDSMEASG